MSRRISNAPAYHLAIRQARASEIFSPYLTKILVRLDDGQWAVREGDKTRGELAAVLDVSHETGERDRYEITRETTVASGGRRMNYGALFTAAVHPHNKVQSIWAASTPWGGI
jgi:hypothetical protein